MHFYSDIKHDLHLFITAASTGLTDKPLKYCYCKQTHCSMYSLQSSSWDIVLCSLEADQCFRGMYCLHYHGDKYSMKLHDAVSQKAIIFILAADRT
jgi:hypothetical protein